MTRFLLVLVLFMNITVLLDNHKNNRVIIFLSVIFIALIMGGCTSSQDYGAYKHFYEQNQLSGFEPLYAYLAGLMKSTGAEFQTFMAVYMSTGVILGTIAMKRLLKYGGNYHVIIIMYLVTSIYINTCVMRQFMSYVFYVLALGELVNGKRINYLLMIMLAASFHMTALFALPLVFFGYRRKLLLEIFVTVTFFCVIIFLNNNKIPGVEFILMSGYKVAFYLNVSTRFGFAFCFLFHFTLIFIVLQCLKYLKSERDKNTKAVSIILNSTLYFTLALPLCMQSINFMRIIYFNILPVITCLAIVMKSKPARKKFLFYAFMLVIVWEFTSFYSSVREIVLDNNIINIL